jgi:hypothetical protein
MTADNMRFMKLLRMNNVVTETAGLECERVLVQAP